MAGKKHWLHNIIFHRKEYRYLKFNVIVIQMLLLIQKTKKQKQKIKSFSNRAF